MRKPSVSSRLTTLERETLVRITEAACRDPSIPLTQFDFSASEKRALWRALKKLARGANSQA